MKKRGILLAALIALLLSCRLGEVAEKITPSAPSPGFQVTETPLNLSASPSPTASMGLPLPQESPEEVAKKYYEALVSKEFEEAVNYLSDYSLSLSGTTRQQVVSYFEQQDFKGWRMVDYRVLETKELGADVVIVRVLTKEQAGNNDPQTYDFWVALRKEEERWRLNWNLIVDDVVLNVEPQTVNDVTVQPLRIARYTDRLVLVLKIENNSDRKHFWGWAGEKIASFRFGNRIVDVIGRLEIEPSRTYPDAWVKVDGFYDVYPSTVSLFGWRWASSNSPNLPDPACTPWAYHFDFEQ